MKANGLLSNKSENYFKGLYNIHNFEIIILCILMELSFGTSIWQSQSPKASLVCTFSSIVIFTTHVTNFTLEQVTKAQRGGGLEV